MKEKELFDLLVASIIPDGVKNGEFDPSDLSSTNFNLEAELKCLTKHHPRILLEKARYDSLMSIPNNPKLRYIASTPKGVWSFDLRKIEIPDDWWKEVWIEKYSTYFNREIQSGYKTCVFLPTGWGIDISKQIGFTGYKK